MNDFQGFVGELVFLDASWQLVLAHPEKVVLFDGFGSEATMGDHLLIDGFGFGVCKGRHLLPRDVFVVHDVLSFSDDVADYLVGDGRAFHC
jgi:hypothetical protein